MTRIVAQISFCVLVLSALTYGAGRWLVRNPMSDDTGDGLLWSGGISALVLLFSITQGVSLNIRRSINTGAACIIVFLAAFGAWGLFSSAGQKQFPEMAGLFPYYALLLAGILVLLLAAINLIWRKGSRKAG